jgi:hypothetical protein
VIGFTSSVRAHLRVVLVGLSMMALVVSLIPITTSAAGAAANLDQCINGGVGATPEPCLIGTLGAASFSNWVNGDANGGKAHWREGDFISYRVTLTGLPLGAHNLIFNYQTVHGNKHAIDYLGSFDATETTSPAGTQLNRNDNNPCFDALGTSGCTSPGTAPTPVAILAVPSAILTDCAGSSGTIPGQLPGSFNAFGPTGTTLTSATYVSQNVVAGTDQCSTTIQLNFTEPIANSPIVIAWGGHIGSQADWGAGNSATAINGSPYHMALNSLDGASTGAQDRALASSAVVFTPTIATTLSGTSISVGGSIHDSATLSGASPTATVSLVQRLLEPWLLESPE